MDTKRELLEFECNVDDMTGEAIAFAIDRLFDAGALDVYTTPIGMKKSRPGILIHITLDEEKREDILRAVFKYTSTIGVRERSVIGYTMRRSIETRSTEYGDLRCKCSSGYGTERIKYEYEDIAKIAEKIGCTIDEAIRLVDKE